jgi:N-acetyl-alpha-D-muramate 1-phosphate uridylyltransferase
MKAMILAAGKGTRLGKITASIPKALVEINGKSALQIAAEKCISHGFNDIIINVHHFADMVEEEVARLRKEGFRITISDESEKLLETGGGLYRAKDFFDKDPFLLYNVDIISDIDLSELYSYHIENRALATLAVRNRPGNRFFLVDESGLLRGWENISTGEQIMTRLSSEGLSRIAFLGIHIIEPEIFSYMNEGVYSITKVYLELAKDHNIFTYRNDTGLWCDIGSPENLDFIRKTLGK